MNKLFLAFVLLIYKIEYIVFQLLPSRSEKSILVVRIDAIGDSVIWFDAAKEFRKHFPDKQLVLLCNIAWKEIATAMPYFDEVITLDKNKFLFKIKYRFQLLFQLKKRKFEQIYNPVYSRDFFTHDVLIHHLRSNVKVGYKGSYANTSNTLKGFSPDFVKYTTVLENQADKWYTRLIKSDEIEIMELSRNAHFIRKCLNPNFSSQLPEVPFELPSFPNLPDKYVVLFVGASTTRKLWKSKNYLKIIEGITAENILICGGKGDEPNWEQINKNLKTSKNITNLIGKTSLLELFTIIQKASYIITNDTSASHITVAVKTPSVCLLGGPHFGRFQPYKVEQISEEDKRYFPKVVYYKMDCYGCNTNCIYIKDKKTIWPCIDSISVEQVLEKLREIETEAI
ncbi:MAG: glycosyltransferase family 9 protein [Bacteroidota bacterium]